MMLAINKVVSVISDRFLTKSKYGRVTSFVGAESDYLRTTPKTMMTRMPERIMIMIIQMWSNENVIIQGDQMEM